MQVISYGLVFLSGAVAGRLLLFGTVGLISARVESVPDHWLIDGKYASECWALLNAGVWLLAFVYDRVSLQTFECIFVFSICFCISAVDIVIRKIPNILVLFLFAAAVLLMWNASFAHFQDHLIGMAVSTGLFLAPFLIGKRSGSGDIKYAAAIGIFLGLYYSLLAFVIMSALFFLYASVLFLTKKGGFKTKIALGPYMSAGFVMAFLMLGGML
ncbi:hypothetical protein SDC9_171892 [bioreactor metagenome]|uniref:Prepilin type IV endopeptidase peptidase domain-containing protein n=1 Tax=bioreactor metagenome TaxID=1076179 RepID=A0A645GL92_9ZZZZ